MINITEKQLKEEIARGMYHCFMDEGFNFFPWEGLTEDSKIKERKMAQAALDVIQKYICIQEEGTEPVLTTPYFGCAVKGCENLGVNGFQVCGEHGGNKGIDQLKRADKPVLTVEKEDD